MIKLRNQRISNVVVSTILGHGGDGMAEYMLSLSYRKFVNNVREKQIYVIAKSATRYKNTGNYIGWNPLTWKYVKRVRDYNGRPGILNAYGLTNDGVKECAKKIRKSAEKGFSVIPSFFPRFINGEKRALEETEEAIEIYGDILGPYFFGFEYNASCPNSGEDFRNYRQILACAQFIDETLPKNIARLIKFSPVHSHDLVVEISELYNFIVHWANTFPAKFLFPHQQSPLHKVGGGGYSGPMIFSTAYEGAYQLSRKLLKGRVIFGGGVSSSDDVRSYMRLRKDSRDVSVSICSIVALNPKEAIKIIKETN